MARALEVPLFHLFYDGEEPPAPRETHNGKKPRKDEFRSSGKGARALDKFRKFLAKVSERDRQVLLKMLQEMAKG